MLMLVNGISIAVYIAVLFGMRKDVVTQQIFMSIVFLVALTIVGELDFVLPIYFLFSLLSFLPYTKKISNFTFIAIIYTGIYLLYGLVFQDPTRTIATFIGKVWQFLVFFIVIDSDISVKENDWRKNLWLALIVESILGLYLMQTQTKVDVLSGLVRLGSNAQPITGNISTIVLPVVVFIYCKNRSNRVITKTMLGICLGYLLWIILSGTRGYTLVFVFTMGLIVYDFFTNSSVGEKTKNTRFIIMIVLVLVGFVLITVVPELIERFAAILRVGASIGIRTYENDAVKEFFIRSSLLTELFGIGFGGIASSYPVMADALSKQFSLGMWHRDYYLSTGGAIFHNLYANVILNLGVIGMIAVVLIFIKMWKNVSISCCSNPLARKCMHLFLMGFFLMNYFRWSATCGIGEMIIFALILKKIKQDSYNI